MNRHELADIIRKELLMMRKSGRLEDDYNKMSPNSLWNLPYTFMEHLEKAGYEIKEIEK
jgi:hypothetical protein